MSVEPAAIGTIQLGDSGSDVRIWQQAMRAWQLFWQTCRPTLDVDGDFGPRTHTATLCFQRVIGLSADGIVGKNTRNAMCTELRIIGRGDLADKVC